MLPPSIQRPPPVIVNPNNKRSNNMGPSENPSNKRARISKESSDSDQTSSLAVLASSSVSSSNSESMAQSFERRKQSLDDEYRNRPLSISRQELLAVLKRPSISSSNNESMVQSQRSLDEENWNRMLRISRQELEWIHLLRSRPETTNSPEFYDHLQKRGRSFGFY